MDKEQKELVYALIQNQKTDKEIKKISGLSLDEIEKIRTIEYIKNITFNITEAKENFENTKANFEQIMELIKKQALRNDLNAQISYCNIALKAIDAMQISPKSILDIQQKIADLEDKKSIAQLRAKECKLLDLRIKIADLDYQIKKSNFEDANNSDVMYNIINSTNNDIIDNLDLNNENTES